MASIVGPNGLCTVCAGTGLKNEVALCDACEGSGGMVSVEDEEAAVAEAVAITSEPERSAE